MPGTVAIVQQQRPGRRAPATTWWEYFQGHRGLDMAPQKQSWTCSACSVDWVLLATNLDPNSTREETVGELGYPNCINPDLGLADTQCAVRVLSSYGPQAVQEWIDWDRAYQLCSETAGILNSTIWQHFVAIRGLTSDGQLWIANSAAGYHGIYDTISQGQFEAWSGTWQAVTLLR